MNRMPLKRITYISSKIKVKSISITCILQKIRPTQGEIHLSMDLNCEETLFCQLVSGFALNFVLIRPAKF